MAFSSSIFLFYFLPVFLLLYFLSDKKYKNYIALFGSIIFFIWGAPLFIFVILGSVILNFLFAKYIHKSQSTKRKALLVISVCINAGMLLYIRYANFFIDNFNAIFTHHAIGEMKLLKVLIPVGISFITFHQISYLIDVYRGDHPPMKKIGDYALFILFFPQLISGPIIRIGEISSQIEERVHQYTVDNQLMGFVRFIIGLSKKILIANILGVQVDRIFALTGNELTTPLAWIGILAYAFQIYFDFSGYTDMAIGLARIMGFIFPENFNNPYVSRSITEFWRRWHITLSNWLRDYLFMPLNVKWRNMGKGGLFLSLIITFTLCGLWHNPGWTFIIWGAYQGVLLILDRLFLLKVLKKLGKVPSIIITFVLIVMGWVFFRAENLHQAGHYFRKLFAFDLRRVDLGLKPDFWVMLVIAAIFSFITAFKFGERIQTTVFEKAYNLKRLFVLGIISLLLFILCAGSITSSGYIPFIYFRF